MQLTLQLPLLPLQLPLLPLQLPLQLPCPAALAVIDALLIRFSEVNLLLVPDLLNKSGAAQLQQGGRNSFASKSAFNMPGLWAQKVLRALAPDPVVMPSHHRQPLGLPLWSRVAPRWHLDAIV